MKQVLIWLPLLALPPALAVGYCLGGAQMQAPTARPAGEAGEGNVPNLRAARSAFEQASRLLGRARQASPGKNQDLLRQAIVQYRVCLAYESAAVPAGRLFEDARHNLEVPRLLLEQGQRPTSPVKADEQPRLAGKEPVSAPPVPAEQPNEPLQQAELKPEPSPEMRRSVASSRQPGAADGAALAKPVPGPNPEESGTGKLISVGPDGVSFQPVDPKTEPSGK